MKDKSMKFIKPGKREETTPATKKMKSALLRTYFVSLLCLVLCCTMFFGTTMAWFTDDVTNSGNVISVGTLKVKLVHLVEDVDGEIDEVDLNDSDNSDYQVFSSVTKWYPEYSKTVNLRVSNEGDLPFKYSLRLSINAVQTASEEELEEDQTTVSLEDLLQYFTVEANGANAVAAVDVDADKQEIVIYLANVFEAGSEGYEIYENTLYPESMVSAENGAHSSEVISVTIGLAANAPADIMGQNMQFNIHLIANQLQAEKVNSGENTTPEENTNS